MRHRAARRFWDCYDRLPMEVRRQTDGCYELLKADERHGSLALKEVGRYWSVRVGLHYRALAVAAEEDLVWFWIGHHSDYDRLVGG